MEVQLFANKVCNLRSYAIKAGVRDTEPQARGNTRTFVWIGSGVTPLKWPQQPKSHNPRIVAVHNSAISNQFLLPTEPSTDIEQTQGIIHSWSDDGGGWAGQGTGGTQPLLIRWSSDGADMLWLKRDISIVNQTFCYGLLKLFCHSMRRIQNSNQPKSKSKSIPIE